MTPNMLTQILEAWPPKFIGTCYLTKFGCTMRPQTMHPMLLAKYTNALCMHHSLTLSSLLLDSSNKERIGSFSNKERIGSFDSTGSDLEGMKMQGDLQDQKLLENLDKKFKTNNKELLPPEESLSKFLPTLQFTIYVYMLFFTTISIRANSHF